MNQAVVVVDSVEDPIMTALIKQDQFMLMTRRGWIKSNGLLFPGKTVYTIAQEQLVLFLQEASI